MKVGSIVTMIDYQWKESEWMNARGIKYPVPKKDYTIREIRKGLKDNGSNAYLILEEIVNKVMPWKGGMYEPAFNITKFRELLPPIEIDLEELICVPIER